MENKHRGAFSGNLGFILAAIGSDTTIKLEGGTYNLSKASNYGKVTDNRYYHWEKVSDGYELVFDRIDKK